jgi:hypothetical protein
MTPFVYPAAPHVCRHGPKGYADHGSYRPWLRDEFGFRCVYCLVREQWGRVAGLFDIDHFLPAALRPHSTVEYDDLLYACATCNEAKGDDLVPNPCEFLLSGAIAVRTDGVVEPRTTEARRIVRKLGLDDVRTTEFRLMWIAIVELAHLHDPVLFQRLMGYPDDLPDLARLRPPGGNSRQAGIEASYFAQRTNGRLPETY